MCITATEENKLENFNANDLNSFYPFCTGDELLISTMFVCGDSYLMLAKCQGNLAVHQEDYFFKSVEDEFISEVADGYISIPEGHSSSVKFVCDLEQNMLKR